MFGLGAGDLGASTAVPRRAFPWVLRAVWVIQPFAVGPAAARALDPHSAAVRVAASVLAWAGWAIALVATLVPHPLGLTGLRLAGPAAAAAAVWAAATGHPGTASSALAVAAGCVAAVVVLLPACAMWCVNGPAYPNERRFPLAPPGPLLLGPLEVAWAAVVGLPVAAVLLLAARQWAGGAACLVAAAAAGWVVGRSLHGLSMRWLVFVPAGVVLHDHLSLADPVLVRRQQIESIGPAPADTDSLDLTQRAIGLALELRFVEKIPMVRITPQQRKGEQGSSARVLVTPSRAGAVLAEAATRHIPLAPPDQAATPPPSTTGPE